VTITLGAALEAFIREHEYCGELDTGLGARIAQAVGAIAQPGTAICSRCHVRAVGDASRIRWTASLGGQGINKELDRCTRDCCRPPLPSSSSAFQEHYGFRRESHNGVTERRNVALPNPSHFPVAALVGHGGLRCSAIPRPSLHDHLYSTHAGESPLEMVVERRVVWAHDDEHFDIRK